jgi:ribosomal protein S13
LSETEKNKYNDLIKKNLIYQPQMRFTARTDLERVFDLLNYKSLRENDRYIIEKQLTKIDLYKYKKPTELMNLQNKKNKKEEYEHKTEEKNIMFYLIL